MMGMRADECVARPAVAAERDVVAALWARCGLTRPWNDAAADFDFALDSGHGAILVADRAGAILGAVMVGHDGHRGAVYYLGVDEAARRLVLGRRLVEAAEAWCRARGVPKINLMVRKENLAVLAFYEAIGYADTRCVSLYRTLDDAAAVREADAKAAWAARLAGDVKPWG
jgi:ribosomal protein S18 acetylase RimI-like enzyme